jgi:hypothetical protein
VSKQTKAGANMLILARALDPAAFEPQPGWNDAVAAATERAKSLVSSSDPADHMTAAFMYAFAPRQ